MALIAWLASSDVACIVLATFNNSVMGELLLGTNLSPQYSGLMN